MTLRKLSDGSETILYSGTERLLVSADVCPSLGLQPNTRRLAQEELGHWTDPTPQKRRMSVVSESGLYKLVMRSDKPEAKDCQNWVTRVVLPAIRKDGSYIQGEEHVVSERHVAGVMSEDELLQRMRW
ncbi:BRO family protein [Sinorhizobium meliloti]|uniref:BRO-N domain-containing protein n=1 Tax=Rhizobium meliloti TaxID=382 RepID=UPI00244E2E24|nr:BRO family protein [Sinorhizobium meliloti]WGI74539.1 BRO family protein [Sinorhizobium meliloti]